MPSCIGSQLEAGPARVFALFLHLCGWALDTKSKNKRSEECSETKVIVLSPPPSLFQCCRYIKANMCLENCSQFYENYDSDYNIRSMDNLSTIWMQHGGSWEINSQRKKWMEEGIFGKGGNRKENWTQEAYSIWEGGEGQASQPAAEQKRQLAESLAAGPNGQGDISRRVPILKTWTLVSGDLPVSAVSLRGHAKLSPFLYKCQMSVSRRKMWKNCLALGNFHSVKSTGNVCSILVEISLLKTNFKAYTRLHALTQLSM